FVFKIPDNLDSHQAAPLLCAGVTTYASLKRYGAGVGVIGIGGLASNGPAPLAQPSPPSPPPPPKNPNPTFLGAHTFITPADFPSHRATLDLILCTGNIKPADWSKYLSHLDVNGENDPRRVAGGEFEYIKAVVEVMPVEKVNGAIQKVRKGDVRYRVVLDVQGNVASP
ncbi:hypothetical protein HK104_005677, partial [Borealophlyctis nickersoniae]